MISPTGVGKTEIARRSAELARAPFIKVEASKFTEVGYVGRDVESIIRDLTELSVGMVKAVHMDTMQKKAKELAEERVLDLLLPPVRRRTGDGVDQPQQELEMPADAQDTTRSKLRLQLREGKLDHRSVEFEVKERTGVPIGVISNVERHEELESGLRDMLGGIFPGKKKKRTMKVPDALKHLAQEEAQKLIDMDEVIREAIAKVEEAGIVFLDEIDKIRGT